MPPETSQKQINAMNKVINHVLDQIGHSREDWENEATVRAAAAQTCSIPDTQALIAAVGLGKNLKVQHQPLPPQVSSSGPVRGGIGPASNPSAVPGKATSTIKTTIKAASQSHPYR